MPFSGAQMEKPQPRGAEQLAQGHTAGQQQRRKLK